MVVKYKDTKVKRQGSTVYYDSEGKETKDPEKIKNIERTVELGRAGRGTKYISPSTQERATKSEFEAEKKLPRKTKTDIQREEVAAAPEEFGLQAPGATVEQPEGVSVTAPAQNLVTLQEDVFQVVDGEEQLLYPAGTQVTEQQAREAGFVTGQENVGQFLEAGALGLSAGLGSAAMTAQVGDDIITGGSAIVQAGNTAKIKSLLSNPLSVLGGLKIFEEIADKLTPKKIDEQQQALNTLGQVTSTIVGDSTSGAGDWRKGLQELQFIEQELLNYEAAIKSGTISSVTLKVSGKIIDINADVYDQLATVNEGVRDIQSFVLQGQFPELSEQQIQAQVRQLEQEGYIKPVNLSSSRR
jgi:hypothetical protein